MDASFKQKKKMGYAVLIKNFATKNYEVMKLRYDPRTGGKGLAVYGTKREAEFCKSIAEVLSRGVVKLRIVRCEAGGPVGDRTGQSNPKRG